MRKKALILIQIIKMKRNVNIAIVGLGQVGIYLYNQLNLKKKDIEKKNRKEN